MGFYSIVILTPINSQNWIDLFNESFDESPGSTSGISQEGISWTANCSGCVPPSDIFEVTGGSLTNRDSNGHAVFSTEGISLFNVSFYNISISYLLSGPQETASDCGDCNGMPLSQSPDCFGVMGEGCWDFFYAELWIEGAPIETRLIEKSSPNDLSGSVTFEGCTNGATFMSIVIYTQTWNNDEIISITDIQSQGIEKDFLIIVPGSESKVCEGGYFFAQEFGTNPTGSWSWTGPNGDRSGPTYEIMNVEFGDEGLYTVTKRDIENCIVGNASIELDVKLPTEAEVISASNSLCKENCTEIEIVNTDKASDNFDYKFTVQYENQFIIDSFMGFMEGNSQFIDVCWNGAGSSFIYNDAAKLLTIPLSFSYDSLKFSLTRYFEYELLCDENVSTSSLPFQLIKGLNIVEPSLYTICVINGSTAEFDLTTKENEILGLESGLVQWFRDSLRTDTIFTPNTYNSITDTIYANIINGNCESNLVSLPLEVTNGETEPILLNSINGNPICSNSMGIDSIRLEFILP
ncbi:MAG: hypothetical protein HKN68_20745, partial [Saprospiraceae bacterium]|nr:hypothetical protein [Saprospiraceae bacterium]